MTFLLSSLTDFPVKQEVLNFPEHSEELFNEPSKGKHLELL